MTQTAVPHRPVRHSRSRARRPHSCTGVTGGPTPSSLPRGAREAFWSFSKDAQDLGAGLPHAPHLHQVAQRVEPSCRFVYLDCDPIVLPLLQALTVSDPRGQVGYLYGDLAHPNGVLAAVADQAVLDLDRPVALILGAVAHHLSDDQNPAAVLKTFKAAAHPGSALILSHAAADLAPRTIEAVAAECRSAGVPLHPRTRSQVQELFDGWDLVEPGLTTTARWRPEDTPIPDQAACCYAGVAVGHH